MNRPLTDSAIHSAIERNAASYDDLPYASHPFPQTQPSHLAAIAHLFGLESPDVRTARVLEIGCASGGNLIPLAARCPEGQFLGIDLSGRQIALGQARIERLALKNVSLRQQSVTDFRARGGDFDYILCHGVYSWVPGPVRKAILRTIRDSLAPTGIAFVSYNVLPGWRLRQTLRDALALHIPADAPLAQRVAQGRAFLDFLGEHTAPGTTWGQIFRTEAKQLAAMSDSYFGHEFLEDCNEPCSVSEFMEKAGEQSLAYLGEADLMTMLPENMNPNAAAGLRGLAGNQLIPLEQQIDILTGRTFRQTLLVHKSHEAGCIRTLLPGRAEGLHFTAPADFAFAGDENGQAVFRTAGGASFSTGDPATRVAVAALISRMPGSSSVDDLVTAVAERGIADARSRGNIADALFKMLVVGILRASTQPVRSAPRLSGKPLACPLLRSDIAAGQTSSATLLHQRIDFDIVGQIVIPALDGSQDRDALIATVREAARAERVAFHRNDARVTDDEEIAACAAEHVDRVLAVAQRHGCLIA